MKVPVISKEIIDFNAEKQVNPTKQLISLASLSKRPHPSSVSDSPVRPPSTKLLSVGLRMI